MAANERNSPMKDNMRRKFLAGTKVLFDDFSPGSRFYKRTGKVLGINRGTGYEHIVQLDGSEQSEHRGLFKTAEIVYTDSKYLKEVK